MEGRITLFSSILDGSWCNTYLGCVSMLLAKSQVRLVVEVAEACSEF